MAELERYVMARLEESDARDEARRAEYRAQVDQIEAQWDEARGLYQERKDLLERKISALEALLDAAQASPEFRRLEKPFRGILDHAANLRVAEMNEMLDGLAEEEGMGAIGVCALVATYIASAPADPELPTEADLHRMAERAAADSAYERFGVTEQNVYLWLSRCARGVIADSAFGDLEGDPDRLVAAPFFVVFRLLQTSAPESQAWDEFLETILTAYRKASLIDANASMAMKVSYRMQQTAAKESETATDRATP